MTLLTGPRLDAVASRAHALVVLLHGYGANGADLIGLGESWRSALPHAAFFAPDAPETVPMTFNGYQWFAITRRDAEEYSLGVTAAAPRLEATIDDELKRLNLDPARLALVGFSQGTMMALHVGLRRANAPSAIVGYSGRLADAASLKRAITARPPVLLVHGDADDVIPVGQLHHASAALKDAGVAVTTHVSHGVGHGIGEDGLRIGGRFIADSLARQT